ncbi:hypothetical protein AMAG_00288 [Allomyces macrogynus ATCC 38327]|uniref:DinB-like domain-containing protein n=1 Tax=Allomyces macrogynus (strain ATCC 38327) TaxID=578462 RepID=A0A0L0RVG4_ALLM3|nr:hypothetical protein AMAG_00288 [Allomyces macrogynus ATCC 38327]|eukprot:KNE54303.1 hypothetical protein AMAG_00288 [Allomyces macrogynus ATCC 38327]
MAMISLVAFQARSNQWANDVTMRAVQAMSKDHYHAHAGLCFRSVHATLTHILLAERIWYMRVTGSYKNNPAYEEAMNYWRPQQANAKPFYAKPDDTTNLWEGYATERDQVCFELADQSSKWVTYVSSLVEADLTKDVIYFNSAGHTFIKPLWQILHHVFNHGTSLSTVFSFARSWRVWLTIAGAIWSTGTHHRGQISAAIAKFGYKPPEMDVITLPAVPGK